MRKTIKLPYHLFWLACILALFPIRVAAQNTILSVMPSECLPGISFGVTNSVTADLGVGVYAVEDQVPSGWSVTAISHSGRFDAANRKVKWGPFFDRAPRALSYRITPPENATGLALFSGTGFFNDSSITIGGVRQCSVILILEANKAVSSLPNFFEPGVPFDLSDVLTPAANVTVYALEEELPLGWTAMDISDGGTFDEENHKIKWGPFFDSSPRTLTCQILPSTNASGTVQLIGLASFDGVTVTVTGDRETIANNSTVISSFNSIFQPGVPFSVTLTATPVPETSVYAIEDKVPAGWTVSSITQSGSLDPDGRTVKWGPFFDDTPRTLSYQVTASAEATGLFSFAGRGSFDEFIVVTKGNRITLAASSRVVRSMPAEFLSGIAFTVTNTASPAALVGAYAIEEIVPAGWVVSTLSHGGTFDANNGKVKWGPFFDSQTRILTYLITPSLSAVEAVQFSGLGSFDGVSVPTLGTSQISPTPFTQANSVIRQMPVAIRSGLTFTVTNTATAALNVSVYALEDQLPEGWIATNITQGGVFEPIQRKVKWGPFFDNTSRIFTYQVTVPVEASGPSIFSGVASFDGASVAISGVTTVNAVPNHAPLARPDTVEREAGQPITVSVSQILANDSDTDGDVLTFRLITTTTEEGATLSLASGIVTYSVPANPASGDVFSYEISDAFGAIAVGQVTVIARPPQAGQNIVGITSLESGAIHLEFLGLPERTYLIQASDSLESPAWLTLGSAVASTIGEFHFDDTDAGNHLTRFYRTVAP